MAAQGSDVAAVAAPKEIPARESEERRDALVNPSMVKSTSLSDRSRYTTLGRQNDGAHNVAVRIMYVGESANDWIGNDHTESRHCSRRKSDLDKSRLTLTSTGVLSK